eukprot:356851-Chlamydomonas_euryale.AAC.1
MGQRQVPRNTPANCRTASRADAAAAGLAVCATASGSLYMGIDAASGRPIPPSARGAASDGDDAMHAASIAHAWCRRQMSCRATEVCMHAQLESRMGRLPRVCHAGWGGRLNGQTAA